MTKKKKGKSNTRRKKVEKKPKGISLAEKAIIIALIAVVLIGASYIALNMLGPPSGEEQTLPQTPTETPYVEETPESTPPSTSERIVLKDMGEAPEFTLKSTNGETVRLDDFHGKVVLLDFWAIWCNPCRRSIPELKRLRKSFPEDAFTIVSINIGEEAEKVKGFALSEGMEWIVLLDERGLVANKYGVKMIPTFILLDKNGRIRLRVTGLTPSFYETLSDAIQQLLQEP